MFLSLKQFKEWITPEEKLITKQKQIFATTITPIQIDENRTLKAGVLVKIICRIDGDRLGISTDLHGNTTEVIISDTLVTDIHLER